MEGTGERECLCAVWIPANYGCEGNAVADCRDGDVQIHFEGAQHYLGTYETPEEAAKAYDKSAREHHGRWIRT